MLEYRMTDAEMVELCRCAPGIKWKHSRDGGAEGRISGLMVWLTRESPYYDPRGGWMAQILVRDDKEAQLVRTSIAKTVAAVNAAPVLAAEVERLTALLAAARVAVEKLYTECRHDCACVNLLGRDCDCGAAIAIELRRAVGLDG
jgi:hypothetical protein